MALVTGLAITPVKGTQMRSVDELVLRLGGVRENRRFYLIDERGRMLNGKQLGDLQTVLADYSDAERRLRLTFPTGQLVEGVVQRGDPVQTRFFSQTRTARLIDGPWSQALSNYLGQPLALVEAGAQIGAVDRGAGGGSVSLISRASLARLAEAGGETAVDWRRFRMLFEIDGVGANAEDRWVRANSKRCVSNR